MKKITKTLKLLIIIASVFFIQCKREVIAQKEVKNLPSYLYEKEAFQAVGHRGYSDIYPENTLLALEEAFKRGVRYSEIDVNVTSDDVYVLFHDQPTMYRTSNGQGYVVASTYKELLTLDVGSWKGSQFKNTKIATLEEALLLAEKYDAYLYLDAKKFRPDLMAKLLKKTKVNPKRLMSSISSIERAKEYAKYCPDSPFIYFGSIPEDVNDDKWYKEFVDLGCEIFEVYYTTALKNEEKFQTFVKKVHQHKAKVWVFTSNDTDEIKTIKNHNVDGVESDLASSALKALYHEEKLKIAPLKATTGNWNFDAQNLQSKGIGSQMRPLNYSGDTIQKVTYGTTSSFKIKSIGDKDAPVIKIPAFTPKNGLFVFSNFTPDKNEDLHYKYSLIMDVYIPKESKDKYICLLQTSPTNSNEGELFIGTKGIGINNVYHGDLHVETWYRISLVFDETSIKKYLNGKLIGEQPISGGRWSVYNTFPGGQNQGFLIFSDNNNDTSSLYVNAVQLRNYSMNPTEIELLGNPKADGIAINNTGIYDVKFENEVKPSIVNWDSNEIYVTLPNESPAELKMSFKLPYGAKSSIESGDEINFNNIESTVISVIAQDGVTKTYWKIIPILKN